MEPSEPRKVRFGDLLAELCAFFLGVLVVEVFSELLEGVSARANVKECCVRVDPSWWRGFFSSANYLASQSEVSWLARSRSKFVFQFLEIACFCCAPSYRSLVCAFWMHYNVACPALYTRSTFFFFLSFLC